MSAEFLEAVGRLERAARARETTSCPASLIAAKEELRLAARAVREFMTRPEPTPDTLTAGLWFGGRLVFETRADVKDSDECVREKALAEFNACPSVYLDAGELPGSRRVELCRARVKRYRH